MSIITAAAALALKADLDSMTLTQRARLQVLFTDGAKQLIDVSKLTTALANPTEDLLILTDGTVFVAVTRDGFRLVTEGDPPGEFVSGRKFASLAELGELLAVT